MVGCREVPAVMEVLPLFVKGDGIGRWQDVQLLPKSHPVKLLAFKQVESVVAFWCLVTHE